MVAIAGQNERRDPEPDFARGEVLRRDCAAISNELREQYTVGFLAPDPLRTDYRSLRVDVPGKPELTTRLRNGVTVRVRPETADAGSDAPMP